MTLNLHATPQAKPAPQAAPAQDHDLVTDALLRFSRSFIGLGDVTVPAAITHPTFSE